MSALTEARARLAAGYYNSNPKSVANPGGLAANGHQSNFPAALVDLGLTLTQAGIDAAAQATAMPTINAGAAAAADAMAYRDQTKAYRDQAQEIVGIDLSAKANLASPAFTGSPTAPTPTQAENSNRLATTAFVVAKLAAIIGASPSTLDTLNELAAALGNDPNFATTMATSLANKLPLAGGTLTGPLFFSDPAAAQKSVIWSYAGGRTVYLYGNAANFGAQDDAAGGGSIWAYNLSTKQLDIRAGVTAGGSTIWTTGNLSPADLGSAQTISGRKVFSGAQGAFPTTADGGVLVVRSTTGAAYLGFERAGNFGAYLGLDTDNQLKWGGWSHVASVFSLWHSGNDGAGSGLDADLFRGSAPDVAGSGGTIAKRGSDGSLQSALFTVPGTGSFSFSTYGGGLYMSDITWMRALNDKSFVTGGTVQAATVRETSDARLKRDYAPLLDAGDLVDRTVVYRGKKVTADGLVDALYVLAQDQRAVTPEVVAEGADLHADDTPLLTVNYGQLALIAIACLQEERAASRRRDAQLAELVLRLEGAGL